MPDISQSIKVKNCIEKRKMLIGEENWKLLRSKQQADYRNKKKELLGSECYNKNRADNQANYRKKKKELLSSELNDKVATLAYTNQIIDNIIDDVLHTIPKKRGPGRPKLTDEEKEIRKKERMTKK